MFLLDTNVVSELRRPKPHGGVLAWFDDHRNDKSSVAAVTIGEIQSGIERTRSDDSAKANEIEQWLETLVAMFDVIPMDAECFREWARLLHGKSDDLIEDAMIAATARVHQLTVVTRNVRDFKLLGATTLDPFKRQR